jgi:hypothetical protein
MKTATKGVVRNVSSTFCGLFWSATKDVRRNTKTDTDHAVWSKFVDSALLTSREDLKQEHVVVLP